jgi:hypothetical protein
MRARHEYYPNRNMARPIADDMNDVLDNLEDDICRLIEVTFRGHMDRVDLNGMATDAAMDVITYIKHNYRKDIDWRSCRKA